LLTQSLTAFEQGLPRPRLISVLTNLGNVHFNLGRLAKAEEVWQRALRLLRASYTPASKSLEANLLTSLGILKLVQSRPAEAEPLITEAVMIAETDTFPPGERVNILVSAGRLYTNARQWPRAESVYRRALSLAESTNGSDHPYAATVLRNMARLRIAQKHFDEAVSLLRRGLDIDEKTIGERHPYYGLHLSEYAAVLRKLKRNGQAKAAEERAGEIGRQHRAQTAAIDGIVNVRDLRAR
jgi:tetratricopeptide (TPR) repeat protein